MTARLDAMEPRERIAAYDAAVRQAYWERKDVAAVRALARAGIERALALADDAADLVDAEQFRGTAKTIAYNLASFTWPGWAEPAVTLAAADVADGRDTARLNLRLAILLGRSDKTLADAWWLIGAHALAERDLPAAAEAFVEARAFAERADEPMRVVMLDGYAALVALLADPAAAGRFDAVVATLRDEGSAYAEQLVTARRVLAPKPA